MSMTRAAIVATVVLCAVSIAGAGAQVERSDSTAPLNASLSPDVFKHSFFDFDRDGVQDLVLRKIVREGTRSRYGIQVISGTTGEVLFHAASPSIDDDFGASVTLADDMGGDHVPELLIAAPAAPAANDSASPGVAYLLCGATGRLLATYAPGGAQAVDRFATRVERLNDLNDDGYAELCIWSEFRANAPGNGWRVGDVLEFPSVISGRTGEILLGDWELVRVARPVGDVNGDGIVDAADAQELIASMGRMGEGATYLDLNRDGRIGPADMQILIENLGRRATTRAAGAATPPRFVDDPCAGLPEPPTHPPGTGAPGPHIPGPTGDPTSGPPRDPWNYHAEDFQQDQNHRPGQFTDGEDPYCPPNSSETEPGEPEVEPEGESDPCEPKTEETGWVLWVNSDDDDLDGWIDLWDPEINSTSDTGEDDMSACGCDRDNDRPRAPSRGSNGP